MKSIRNAISPLPVEPKRSAYTPCAANGCPLLGSICGSTHPTDASEWVCRFHFGEPREKWQSITHWLRNNDYTGLLSVPMKWMDKQEVEVEVEF